MYDARGYNLERANLALHVHHYPSPLVPEDSRDEKIERGFSKDEQ